MRLNRYNRCNKYDTGYSINAAVKNKTLLKKPASINQLIEVDSITKMGAVK